MSLFSNTTNTASGGGLFGGSSTAAKPATGGGLFGSSTATTAAPASGGGLFGSSTATTAAPASGGGLFGTSTATTAAPASGGGLFGSSTATTAAPASGGGLFGTSNTGISATAPVVGSNSAMNPVIMPQELVEKLQKDVPKHLNYPASPEFNSILEHIHAEKCSISNVEKKADDLLRRQNDFKMAIDVTVSPLLDKIKTRHNALQKQFLTVVGLMEDAARLQNNIELDTDAMSQLLEHLLSFQHRINHSNESDLRRLDVCISDLDVSIDKGKKTCRTDIDSQLMEEIKVDRDEQIRDLGKGLALLRKEVCLESSSARLPAMFNQ